MLVERTSFLTGITRTLDIEVTQEQVDAWNNGMLIQNAMPHLSADDREFLLTGATPDEWDEAFKDEEE